MIAAVVLTLLPELLRGLNRLPYADLCNRPDRDDAL